MKTDNLNVEEREILDSYERGEWQPTSTREEREQYKTYAAATVETRDLIGIRLPLEDLRIVQRKAVEAGIPYQKLIADVVHKFVSGRLIEQPAT